LPEVPLPDAGRAVAILLQEAGDRQAVRGNQRIAIHLDNPRLQPGAPIVAARQNAVAGRAAHGRGGVGIGETHPPGGQPVYVRRGDFPRRIKAGHITISQIVGKDIYNVGTALHGSP